MRPRKLRHRFAVASSLGAAAMAAVLLVGLGTAGTASAGLPTIPAFPTFGTYPSWLPANDQISNVDHAEGSDTTLYVMQAISDLYSESRSVPVFVPAHDQQPGLPHASWQRREQPQQHPVGRQ